MTFTSIFPLVLLLALTGERGETVQFEPRATRFQPDSARFGPIESVVDLGDEEPQSGNAAGEDDDEQEHEHEDEREHDDDDEDDADAPPDKPEGALELELTALGGTRGDGAGDAKLRWVRPGWSIALGAGNGGGAQAVQRQWIRAEASVELGVELSAGALWQPPQAGATQEELRASASGDTERGHWEAALAQESASLSAQAAGTSRTGLALSGATASLELAHRVPWRGPADEPDEAAKWSALVSLQGGLFSLSLPKSAAMPWAALGPWDRLGDRALAWPSRAQAGAGVEVEGIAGKLRGTLGAGLPAQTGAAEMQAAISGERAFGPATLSLELSAARLFPGQLWLGGVQAGVRWRFGLG